MIRVEHISVDGAPDRRIALVLLDRPEKRNALTPDALANLAEIAHHIRAGVGRADAITARRTAPPHAIVLAGEGPVFCAGFDLTLCRDDARVTAALLMRLSHAVRALRRISAPVIVAAHGAAVAGGCALLGGGDIVVTDQEAKIGYPVLLLGVSPAVSAPTLTASIADSSVRRLLLDPALMRGADAVRIGLAHELVECPNEVRARAIEIASALARKPTNGIHATKRWINEIDGSAADDRFESALAASLALAGGAEERTRLEAHWKIER